MPSEERCGILGSRTDTVKEAKVIWKPNQRVKVALKRQPTFIRFEVIPHYITLCFEQLLNTRFPLCLFWRYGRLLDGIIHAA